MTTINLTNVAPSTLSNIVATGIPEGIKIRWDTPVDKTLWQTEVWVSSTNDRSAATLAFTTFDNTYIYTTTGGNTRYFWIRAKNIYGYNNGAWLPTSSTGGVSATALISDVAGGGTTSASISGSSGSSSPTVTNFETWYSVNNISFTAPAKGTISAYMGIQAATSTAAGGSLFDSSEVWVRLRMYDDTAAADVVGGTMMFKVASWYNSGTWVQGLPDQVVQQNFYFNSDIMGHMIGGHSYHIYGEIMKTRTTGTTQTLTVTVNSSWGQVQAGATYG